MADKFNLADVLSGRVSNLDHKSREQIEYIDIGCIDSDELNFYKLTDLDGLASNIALVGLQQPIRVRSHPEDKGRVVIVSGHRRRAALQLLIDEGHDELRQVPCIRERSEESSALQELKLIYANSDTRKMSPAEIDRQAERVEELLYRLKEEGVEFPGRMRDHVAEACKVSSSKLARLKVIREGLAECWSQPYGESLLAESTAYALARMPGEHQELLWRSYQDKGRRVEFVTEKEVSAYGARLARISEAVCEVRGVPCGNMQRKMEHALTLDTWYTMHCAGCCSECPNLAKCKHSCPLLAEKVKALKAEASAQRKQEKLEQEEKDRPAVDKIKALWSRFGKARAAAAKTVRECYGAAHMYYSASDEDKQEKMERLEVNFSTGTSLPYGYGCSLQDVEKFTKMADFLGCSLDYLLCRTDDPCGTAGEWRKWEEEVPCAPLTAAVQFDVGLDKPHLKLARWNGKEWTFFNGAKIEAACLRWYPLPEEE